MTLGFWSTVAWFLFWWTIVGSVVALLLAQMMSRADAGEVDLDALAHSTQPGASTPVSTRYFHSSYRSNLSRK